MSPESTTTTKWASASYVLRDAFTDFILSRQAIQCTARTLGFYEFALSKFIAWLESQGVSKPEEVTARLVRSYMAELTGQGLADTTLHGNARAIRTLVRFWHAEGYLLDAVKFAMPKLTKKRLPVLTAEQVGIFLRACHNPRDKAVILLMVDTGIRLNEAINLDWCDLDIMTGLARVRRGKGGKACSVVAGATPRRALLAYRRTLHNTTDPCLAMLCLTGRNITLKWLMKIYFNLSRLTHPLITCRGLRRVKKKGKTTNHAKLLGTVDYVMCNNGCGVLQT